MSSNASEWSVVRYLYQGAYLYGLVHRRTSIVYFASPGGWEARRILKYLREAEDARPYTAAYNPEEWKPVE